MTDTGRAHLTYYTEQNVYSIRLARKLLKDRSLTNYSKGEQTVLCTIILHGFTTLHI